MGPRTEHRMQNIFEWKEESLRQMTNGHFTLEGFGREKRQIQHAPFQIQ